MRRFFDNFRSDLRYGWRQLRQAPAFTAFVTASLAIGIGIYTVVFGAMNAQISWKLPVAEPEQLRQIVLGRSQSPEAAVFFSQQGLSYPAFAALRDSASSLSGISCSRNVSVIAEFGGATQRMTARLVSGGYFESLGIAPAHGRFVDSADPENAPATAMIGYRTWQQNFGGVPEVLGETIVLNGAAFEIAGVLPYGFSDSQPGNNPQLILPIAYYGTLTRNSVNVAESRDWSMCRALARLRDGASDEQALSEIRTILRQAYIDGPPAGGEENRNFDVRADRVGGPGFIEVVRLLWSAPNVDLGDAPLEVFMMVFATGGVLLIACANIAGLLLSRFAARRHEFATRLALGARRTRIVRQLMTESVLLACIGGVCGVLLAYVFELTLRRLVPVELDIILTPQVLVFALGVSMLTGILFGLSPALTASRMGLDTVMKQGSTRARGERNAWVGKGLIALQVAASLLLLVCAGVGIDTLTTLRSVDLGYDPEGILTFTADPGASSGYDLDRSREFFSAAMERLNGLPAVASASSMNSSAIGAPSAFRRICVDGYVMRNSADTNIRTDFVGLRYFETVGIPLRAGREFDAGDRAGAAGAVIVNEAFVRRFFPGQAVLGQTFQWGNCEEPGEIASIAGVVADVRSGVDPGDVLPALFLPSDRSEARVMRFVIAFRGASEAIMPAVQEAMRYVDPAVPVFEMRFEQERVEEQLQAFAIFPIVLAVCGGVALLLACVGIYGTLAYSVNRRIPEIGIRMALGARPPQIVQMVVRQVQLPVAIGVIFGLAAAVALTRLATSALVGVRGNDPLSIVAAVLVLAVTAGIAAAIPARRAARTDPMRALRYE